MRKIFNLLLFLISTSIVSAGVSDSLTNLAIKKYDAKSYSEALSLLNKAISKKGDNTEALYFRGRVFIELAKNSKFNVKEPYLKASQDFIAAKEGEVRNNKWSTKAIEKLISIETPLYKRAMFLYKSGLNKKTEALKVSTDYFKILTKVNPKQYIYFDYLGNSLLSISDTNNAIISFENAHRLAVHLADGFPDYTMGYSYYRLAKLYGLDQGDVQKGMIEIANARDFLNHETYELEHSKFTITNSDYNKLKNDREELVGYLDRLELELSSRGGDYMSTIDSYEKAIDKNPKDIPVLIAYASFVEEKSVMKAIGLYEKAIKVDSTVFSAYYGIGALLVKQGTSFMTLAREAKTNDQIITYKKMGMNYYSQAIPYYEKAYALNSKEQILLQTIIQLSTAVGDIEVKNKYTALSH